MAEVISDRRDIDFVLYEQLDTESILKSDAFASLDKKMADMIVKEARNLAIKEILPTYMEGDRKGVQFDKGSVSVPECFRRVHKLLVQGEWGALTADPAYGGQGLPHTIAQAAMEYMIGANYTLMTYAILGQGAGKMVDIFVTQQQKKLFLKSGGDAQPELFHRLLFRQMVEQVAAAAENLRRAAMDAAKAIHSPQSPSAFAAAHPLMDAAGDVVMAWMLLWRASAATPALAKQVKHKPLDEILQTNKTAAFYHGKIMAAEFFINTLLPVAMGKLNGIDPAQSAAVTITENSF